MSQQEYSLRPVPQRDNDRASTHSRRSSPSSEGTNINPPKHNDLLNSCKQVCSLVMKYDDKTKFYLGGMLHNLDQILRSGEARKDLGHPPTIDELNDAYLKFRECFSAPGVETATRREPSVDSRHLPLPPSTERAHRAKKIRIQCAHEKASKKKKNNHNSNTDGKVATRIKNPSACSFCRDTNHRYNTCPKKDKYGVLIAFEGKQDYLNYLKQTCPVHRDVIGDSRILSSFTTSGWKHIQVKSIHPRVTTDGVLYIPEQCLAAKVSVISGANNDVIPFAEKTKNEQNFAYIKMSSLERVIHSIPKARLIFDRTRTDSHGVEYNNRTHIPNRQIMGYNQGIHRSNVDQNQYQFPNHPVHPLPRHPRNVAFHPYQNQYECLHNRGALVQNGLSLYNLNQRAGVPNFHTGTHGLQHMNHTVPFQYPNYQNIGRDNDLRPRNNVGFQDQVLEEEAYL